jgi:mannose-1-phosphate guanylyltransferase
LSGRLSDAIIVAAPTDQYIADEKRYLEAIETAIGFVRANGYAIVTLGVKPTYPATQYGYLKTRSLNLKDQNVLKVECFTEKPDLKTAKMFLKDGSYLWNSGLFIFRADAYLKAVEKHAPDIYERVKYSKNMNLAYKRMPDISVDYAVMEKSGDIFCVSGSYGWKDMGSFDSIKEILRKESRSFVEKGGKMIKII